MNKKVISIIITLFFFTSFCGCIETNDELEYNKYKATIETLDDLLASGDFEEIISVVTTYLEENDLNDNNFDVLSYRALSYSTLAQEDLAIQDYETMLPLIYDLDEVEQKGFSYDIYSLGILYSGKGNIDQAYEYIRYAVQIDPVTSASDNNYTASLFLVYDLSARDDYEGMISVVTNYFNDNDITLENYYLLIYRAGSYANIDQEDKAIEDYEAMVSYIKMLGNIEQREYSTLFFSLGILYAYQGDSEKALEHYNYGLQLEPGTNYYQIQLGQVYEELGQDDNALQHYQDLQESLSLTTEEEAIVQMKIDILSGSDPELDFTIQESYDPAFSIKIIPINEFSADIDLEDMALLLQSKFRVTCEVLSEMEIPESEILDQMRNQYDAGKIVEYLEENLDSSIRNNSFPIIITSYDMFQDTSNFIFSRQDYDADMGIISTYMFESTVPLTNESNIYDIILGRRIGIQFISTVGQLFGSARPTSAICPLAYPHSIEEFSLKSSKLCPETQNDVDERIQQVADRLVLFTEKEMEDITTLYEKYYFE